MKPPLVLLHGWGVSSLIWNPILPLLENDFDLTVVDLPGYGKDVDYVGEYLLTAIVEEVLSRVPDRANWIGWSLGGTIAMAAALDYPERIQKLQLVSTTPRFLRQADWECGVALEPFTSLAAEFEKNYEQALGKFLLLLRFTNDRSKLKRIRTWVRETTASFGQINPPSSRTLQEGLQILSQTDLRPRLSELKVETQIIAGRNDHIVPVKACQFLFDHLPMAHSLHVFESGHLPFQEEPSKYIEALTNFMNPINETC